MVIIRAYNGNRVSRVIRLQKGVAFTGLKLKMLRQYIFSAQVSVSDAPVAATTTIAHRLFASVVAWA